MKMPSTPSTEAIWRTAGDEGLQVGAAAEPGIMDQVGALFSQKFTKQPWYGVDPITFDTGVWTLIKAQLDRYFPAAAYNPLYGNATYTSTNRNEALGVGFYFSRVAGDPKILDAVTGSRTQDSMASPPAQLIRFDGVAHPYWACM